MCRLLMLSIGEGNGNPLQYPCLEDPMDGEVWQATVHGLAKSRTLLIDFTFLSLYVAISFVTEPYDVDVQSEFNSLLYMEGKKSHLQQSCNKMSQNKQ